MKEQAQTIMDEYYRAYFSENKWFKSDRKGVAAVLRTAALYCKRDNLILLSLAEELETLNELAQEPQST